MADGSGLPRQITYGSVLLADMVSATIEQHTVMTAEQEWMAKRMDDSISRQTLGCRLMDIAAMETKNGRFRENDIERYKETDE